MRKSKQGSFAKSFYSSYNKTRRFYSTIYRIYVGITPVIRTAIALSTGNWFWLMMLGCYLGSNASISVRGCTERGQSKYRQWVRLSLNSIKSQEDS